LRIKDLIQGVLEEELKKTDCFLVGVKSNDSDSDFKFFIDGKEGVGIKVIGKLSRAVSAFLDEADTGEKAFRYEISSPGVDNPLIDKRQYYQHIGRDLAISLADNSIVEGELIALNEEELELSVKIGKNKKEKRVVSFENIKKSTVQISFKPKKK
jgi:ribosome maturation factor RimP